MDMILNYFKIACRNLVRNPVYSVINVLGLALGISGCILLSLYVRDDFSYDQHHARAEDVYRVVTLRTTREGSEKLRTTSAPVAAAMRAEIPEVETSARVLNPGISQNLIQYGDKLFYEPDGCVADSTLFDVLTYDLIEGDPKRALDEPNSVVLADRLAEKLFGEESALGKQINISQIGPAYLFTVTGVFRTGMKTHIDANFFLSMTSEGRAEHIAKNPAVVNDWAHSNFLPTYVKLAPGHDKKAVEKKMDELMQRHAGAELMALGVQKTLLLEPIKDFYLRTDATGFDGVSTKPVSKSPRIIYNYVITSIAIFILLIACINFMNLSTAKATRRAGEIGIRKVMGAVRASLIGQVLCEAMVVVMLSIFFSVIIVQLTFPFFNLLTGKSISFGTVNVLFVFGAFGVIAILTGFVAGAYPAFYLSSFQPAQVLKGKFNFNGTGWLRKSLVVFQFMITIGLVCGMLIIGKQLRFMQSADLGFNPQYKIALPLRTAAAQSNYETLRNELNRSDLVSMASGTRYIPSRSILSGWNYYAEGGNEATAIDVSRNRVDYGYIELLGIKMVAGMSFTGGVHSLEAERNVIANETCAKQFGFTPQEFVGQHLYYDVDGQKEYVTIMGVMEDIHQTSVRNEVSPTVYYIPHNIYSTEGTQYYDYLVANVDNDNFQKNIAAIEAKWKDLVKDTPFEYTFLDETIQAQYDGDRKVSGIISSFTFIALFISCLGLYGLSSYMSERRFKEIGVRKVLGASVRQITLMMSAEFVKLVIVAFILAAPFAWYVMNQWLEGFVNKAPIDVSVFILAGVGALTVALLTVSVESIRAATANPVDSLKVE